MAADAGAILDQAVAQAVALGVSCSGWMVQRDEGGVVAWLYVVDEDGQMLSLIDEVEAFPTLDQAAAWCLAVVESHAEAMLAEEE